MHNVLQNYARYLKENSNFKLEINIEPSPCECLCTSRDLRANPWVKTIVCHMELNLHGANIATLLTKSSWLLRSYHIKRILHALPLSSPLRAKSILILACLAWPLFFWFLKGSHMNPFCCRPLFTFYDRATSMQTVWICFCIGMEAEEKQSITFLRFHCIRKHLC